jgi:mono/diheme cytochrome c family protein
VDKAPRNKGSWSLEHNLIHTKADVIFAFYGYNESYANIRGADNYKKRLIAMVKKYRTIQPNGKSFPRIVLFSPIAYENFGNPNLPDGIAHNKRLAAFTKATEEAAAEAGVAYVDLFGPTFQLYESRKEPFTINGVHLNEDGNLKLAEIIAAALFKKNIKINKIKLAKLNAAVREKNWNWHNKYRATDGNDIWGGRSTLSFIDGQSNSEVLSHELTMLDFRTANRDKVIWAAAMGKSIKVDDSKVPKPVPVKSNIVSKSRKKVLGSSSSVEYKYLTPEESAKKIKVPEGYELKVFASEKQFPGLANPVQMQVDGKGRLWVATWNSYPKWEPGKEMLDSLMILPDENRDGIADKRIIFARVHNPLGFEFWNGGVLVTSGTDLIFLKDTDGDDIADVRYSFLQGLGTADTHHAANNLIYGPDGAIYWQSGWFLVHNHETPWATSLSTKASAMFRFDPRRHTITVHAGNGPNPHGLAFDYWGYSYANDGTGGRSYQVVPNGKSFKMKKLIATEVRPVAAVGIMSSANFPASVQQNYLLCNTIGFLGVKSYKLHIDGYAEKNKKTGDVWGTPDEPFFVSKDKNVRPSDAIVGADGALYVADWHNIIIGHMQHNIRDPSRDHKHGRIFRIHYKNKPLQKPVAIDGEPIEKLLDNLKHPINGVRHRTRVELSERKTAAVIKAAQKWMLDFDVNKEDEAHHLLEALWLHQQHNVRNEALLNKLLGSKIEHARIAAATVKHFWTTVDSTSGRVIIQEAETEKLEPIKAPDHLTGAAVEQYNLGAKVFRRESHCITCHQANGKGMKNVYPPLMNSKWVSGDEQRLIKLTLHGLWGKIKVSGVVYDPSTGVPPMTAFKDILNDKELAAVLTYVRNSWGNKAAPISEKTVKKIRHENQSRTTFWTPEELLKEQKK